MKIKMQMTPEQAAAFTRLFMEGKLDEVVAGFQVGNEPSSNKDPKLVPKWSLVHIVRITAGCIGIGCGLTSLLASEMVMAWVPGFFAVAVSIMCSARSPRGFWVAGLALTVNVAAVSVWGYKAAVNMDAGPIVAEANKNAEVKHEAKTAKITIQVMDQNELFDKFAPEMKLSIGDDTGDTIKSTYIWRPTITAKQRAQELAEIDAFGRIVKSLTKENNGMTSEQIMDAISEQWIKEKERLRSLPGQEYEVPSGKRIVKLQVGQDVIFDKLVLLLEGANVKCYVVRAVDKKIIVKFTPDITKW